MTPQVLSFLDEHLGELVAGADGRAILAPRVEPAVHYRRVPRDAFRLWCHFRGIYGIPTTEAVDWLTRFIAGRSAIEIGAAHGAFGRALGIPRTDSYIQDQANVRAFYAAAGQPRVAYGADVERLEALAAAKRYRPQVVFGSWITQYGVEGQASMYGVREDRLLKLPYVEAYVVFGAPTSHGGKAIAARVPKGWAYRTESRPGFLSRSESPATMFVWTRVDR